MSPTQILYQCDPIYSDLHVFNCLCFPLFPSTSIHKLQERSIPCVYLGPAPNHRGSKCYAMSSEKIIICRPVKFVETVFPFSKIPSPHKDDYNFLDFNPIFHQLHHQSITPPNLAHQADPPSPPRLVASTEPPQTPLSFIGPPSSGPPPPPHSTAGPPSSSPLPTLGTITLPAPDHHPGSPPSFPMPTRLIHQQDHQSSPNWPTPIPTPLLGPTPHPMTTRA